MIGPNVRGTRRLLGAGVALALALGGAAQAQVPPVPGATLPGAGALGGGFGMAPNGPALPTMANLRPAVPTLPGQPAPFGEVSFGAPEVAGIAPPAPTQPVRVEMSVLDTISDSLFGDVYAEGRWRPLTLDTFFSEGWLEPWAGAPAGGEGTTPRHGWLGAFDGVFYRLWFATFAQGLNMNTPQGGQSYLGDFNIFLPLSRRFEIHLTAPFLTSNGTADPGRGYQNAFGDLTIAPRFLLSESVRTTQIFHLAVRVPTGLPGNGGGVMALAPRYEFWTNPFGSWVARGSAGVFVPLNQGADGVPTSFVGGLAIGRHFRPHDVPFGDLVVYGASSFSVPLDGTAPEKTVVTVGPGYRFHLGRDYYFLNYWGVPVVGPKPFDLDMQFALLKVF